MPPRLRRWSSPFAWFLPAAAAILLAGCESSNIVQLSPDVYQITINDRTKFGEMDPANYTHRAVAQAMNFADSKGKVAVTVALDQKAGGIFGDFVEVDYQFRLVDKDDPRALAQKGGEKPRDKKPDHYDELMKLDDLRKKGVLTEAEFTSEKQKLLAK